MNHFYHGLFGSPASWLPINLHGRETFFHDLYLEQKEELLSLKTSPSDVLVGYSLGGRIALEVARRNDFNLRHIILLSAHPGLVKEELAARVRWENDVLHRLQNEAVNDFKKFWDRLPLFSSSELKGDLTETKLRSSAHLFDEFRLSSMPHFFDKFSKYKDKMTWVVGHQDTKYLSLINERVRPYGINTIMVETDHRVLQAASTIKNLLASKGLT